MEREREGLRRREEVKRAPPGNATFSVASASNTWRVWQVALWM